MSVRKAAEALARKIEARGISTDIYWRAPERAGVYTDAIITTEHEVYNVYEDYPGHVTALIRALDREGWEDVSDLLNS